MKQCIICFLVLTLTTPLFSHSRTESVIYGGTIKGVVLDRETQEPLPGANVIVEHTTVGAATRDDGTFEIKNAPTGTIRLAASMIGYRQSHQTITVRQFKTTEVTIELEQTILEMGAVVVTGTATPHVVEDTPVRTEVIPRRIIEQKHAVNLAEALTFHTGVRVENNCSNCNFSQVRMLGMDGKYSQILIDGDPVVSSLAGVYGLEHFPEEMVDQIEIVKGGGSSLYGGGAVAGVINMITRRPLTNQVRIKYQNNSAGGEYDQHVGAVAERVFSHGKSGAYVFGSFRRRSPYDHNSDGYSELGDLRNESMGFKWFYMPVENGEFLASFHNIHEERRGGNKFGLPVHEADIAEWIEHWRTGGTVRWNHRPSALFDYRVFYSFSNENRKSYYGGLGGDTPQDQLDALAFYGRTDNPMHIAGAQVNYQLSTQLLTAGIQYKSDHLMDETAAETAYHIDETYTNTGIFIQDNIHFGPEEQAEFVVGVRMDNHSALEDWICSPRINGKFSLGNGMNLRAAYTTGFKAPQTYDEDLHLCGIEGDQRVIRNSAGLKQERSRFVSAGFEFLGTVADMPSMLSVTAFSTRLSGAFSEQFVSKQGNTELWERVNADGASVNGMEIDLGLRPTNRLQIRGGATYKKSEYDEVNEDFGTKNFLRTPDFSGNLSVTLNLSSSVNIYINSMYIGEAEVPHEKAVPGRDDPELVLEQSESYAVVDAGLFWKLPLNHGLDITVKAGMKNIFDAYQDDLDAGPDRDPAYVYGPSRPRTLFFGVQTAF